MSRQYIYIQKITNSGFTIIEILISMVISSFVIAGMYGIYTIQQRSYTGQEQVAEMQQRARSALSFLVREIRMASYIGTCSGDAEILKAETQEFSFSYCNDNSGSLSTNTFILYDAHSDNITDLGLLRDDATEPTAVAEGVDTIEFRYLDKTTGQELPSPVSNTSNIGIVQVSLLVRSSYPDPKYTDTITYKPASERDAGGAFSGSNWDINGTANGTGNPPTSDDDKCDEVTDRCHYRRRLLITSINIRNNI